MADEERVEEEEDEEEEEQELWVRPQPYGHEATGGESVHIETGRGQTAEVQVGAPFQETIERIADEAHYGGYFRVFLNGDELLDPNEAPTVVEAGMRIAICSYDKVG